MIAQFAQVLQLVGIGIVMFGDGVFGLFGMQQPEFMKENKLLIFGGLFMFNTVAQNMMATGAFEITLNGKMVFSKLDQGRMPALSDLIGRFEDAGLRAIGEAQRFSSRQV